MQKLKLDVFYSLQKESAKTNNYSALQIDLSVQFLRNVHFQLFSLHPSKNT